MKKNNAVYLIVLAALLPVLLLRDYTPSNELRYLSIVDEALREGSFFAFTNQGIPYADKPPLYFWAIMLGRWLFGGHCMAFLSLFSLIPAFYTREFKNLTAGGALSLSLWARGEMQGARLPAFELKSEVRDGSFRKDLYFRISVFPIKLPPLRERGGDVVELASYFLENISQRMNKSAPELSEEVREVFASYPWPGNVRELRNVIERILILRSPEDPYVRLADLPAEMLECGAQPRAGGAETREMGATLGETLDGVERRLITDALARCGGNKTQAAAELGISRFSLIRRMQRHGLE